MKPNKNHELLKSELEAVYKEFYSSINQMLLLEKFFKILVEVANGANLNDDLHEFIKKTELYRAYPPDIIKKKKDHSDNPKYLPQIRS